MAARVLISRAELGQGVDRLAAEISASYEDGVVLVAVLKGSVCFLADLVRRLDIQPEVDFLAVSSYAPGTGRVRIVKDLETDIFDRDVVLVEDIVDTGLTPTHLPGDLGRRQPPPPEVCPLLHSQCRRALPPPL